MLVSTTPKVIESLAFYRRWRSRLTIHKLSASRNRAPVGNV
jgi:hypothetical protein